VALEIGADFEDLIDVITVATQRGLVEVFYVLAPQRNARWAELVLHEVNGKAKIWHWDMWIWRLWDCSLCMR
jgi:hypothetical protein